MKRLTEAGEHLLKTIITYGEFGVYAENIEPAAELLRAGYARAEDDYEGPRLIPTELGQRTANKKKLLVPAHGQSQQEKS